MTDKCYWKQCIGFDGDDYYETSCEQAFIFVCEDLAKNGFLFCPYCGMRIEGQKDDPHKGYRWVLVRNAGGYEENWLHIPQIRRVSINRGKKPSGSVFWETNEDPLVLLGQAALDMIEYVDNVISRVYVAGDPANVT